MKRIWYRVQEKNQVIRPSPEHFYYCTSDFEYIIDFLDNVDRPEVLVFSVNANMPVIDLWRDSISEMCGYPRLADQFVRAEAFPTAVDAVSIIAGQAGRGIAALRRALKRIDDRYMPVEDIMAASDDELLEFGEWAASFAARARADGVPPHEVALKDLLAARPGAKGVIDGCENMMLVDSSVMKYVLTDYSPLTRAEVEKLYAKRFDDMRSGDVRRVKSAIDWVRKRGRRLGESGKDGLPVTDLGRVLRLDRCQKQKDMCWGDDGFVLAHKDVNPDFDESKPFIVVIDHDGVWQMHFENFGSARKDEKVLDDMYRAVAASCEKGMELELSGGATPGGLSGFSRLKDYGFKKEPLPDDAIVYWGGELDRDKLEKWLNSGRHDADFLVRTDGNIVPGEKGGVFASPRDYDGEITPDNTKPRPFKMVRVSAAVGEKRDLLVDYWAHMLDEAMGSGDSYWSVFLQEYPRYRPCSSEIRRYLAGLFDRLMLRIPGLQGKLGAYVEAYEAGAGLIPFERVKAAVLASFGLGITDRDLFWEPIPARVYKAVVSRSRARAQGKMATEASPRVLKECLDSICRAAAIITTHSSGTDPAGGVDLSGTRVAKMFRDAGGREGLDGLYLAASSFCTFENGEAMDDVTKRFRRKYGEKAWRRHFEEYADACSDAAARSGAGDWLTNSSDSGIGEEIEETMKEQPYDVCESPERAVPLISRLVDKAHIRGDLAGAFVEGGGPTCAAVSNMGPDEIYEGRE